jgi:translation elongation factor EF-Tu-like GTPase
MARFSVNNVFALSGLGHFVLAGTVVEGRLSAGMKVLFRKNKKELELTIEGVEFIDRVSEKQSDVGLRLSLSEVSRNQLEKSEYWTGNEFECI